MARTRTRSSVSFAASSIRHKPARLPEGVTMKSEGDPITDDEWLLRRVRIEKFRTDRVPIISPNAFEPRVRGCDVDMDGISLYRAACIADPSEVLATVAPERQH